MLVEGTEEVSEEPLTDDFEIESACTVALCASPKKEWDVAAGLIKDTVFELSGPDHSIITKIGDLDNCMMVGSAMEADLMCGVVYTRDDEHHAKRKYMK